MNTNTTTIKEMQKSINVIERTLEIRHATPRGTGCALRIRLIADGCPENKGLLIGFAAQKTVDGIKSEFDWDNPLCAFLNFTEVAQLLQVFRGECESINEGKGIYSKNPDGNSIVKLEHRFEPAMCYAFGIAQTIDGADAQAMFVMNNAEALGICEALSVALSRIAFGL